MGCFSLEKQRHTSCRSALGTKPCQLCLTDTLRNLCCYSTMYSIDLQNERWANEGFLVKQSASIFWKRLLPFVYRCMAPGFSSMIRYHLNASHVTTLPSHPSSKWGQVMSPQCQCSQRSDTTSDTGQHDRVQVGNGASISNQLHSHLSL